jgi:sugar phosphate isomerase/epimerase
MKLGAINTLFLDQPLEEVLEHCQSLGLDCIEIGVGGYTPKVHCDPELLADSGRLDEFRALIADQRLEISALNVSGEPLQPEQGVAEQYDRDFRGACRLAAELGVTRVVVIP